MSATDDEALRAAYELARLEGIIPALEPSHALAVLGRLGASAHENVIINVSGSGDKDLPAYIKYMDQFCR